MSHDMETVIRSLLRSSEELKVVLDARTPPTPASGYSTPTSSESSSSQPEVVDWNDPEKKRVVAVVTHIDPASADEQGCLFVLRPARRRQHSAVEQFAIEYVFPIVGDFGIRMAQPRRNTLDLRSSNISSASAICQPRAEFSLTISPGHDPAIEPIELLTRDTQTLRAVLAECKRLKELSVANTEADIDTPYQWTLSYTSSSKPSILSPIPPDLRHQFRPVHTLLSPASAGQPGDEVFDISLIREEWIKNKVHDFINGYRTMRLRLRIGTFNVNGKLPSQDLSPWVRAGRSDSQHVIPPIKEISPLSIGGVTNEGHDYLSGTKNAHNDDGSSITSRSTSANTEASGVTDTTVVGTHEGSTQEAKTTDDGDDGEDPDLLVLGFQELDLSAEALLYSTKTTREDAWCAAALAGLGEKADKYEKLASKQLVGMLLVVFVRKAVGDCFRDVKSTSVGAGILGLMGNKGAVALRLTFTPPSTPEAPCPRPVVLTFVNSHLAAFDEMYDRRNFDFQDLSKRLTFDSGVPTQVTSPQLEEFPPITMPLNVFQSDALFWMGDLNYRINLPDADIRGLILEGSGRREFTSLLAFDQLKIAMRTHKAFADFTEAPITHPPSYRFNSGMLTDSFGYDMKRKPAWTDRILHMSSGVSKIEGLSYTSHPEVTMSDHRPVSSKLYLHVPLVDMDQLDAYILSQWREVTNVENSDEIPRIRLSRSLIDFGKVYYKRQAKLDLEVENIGTIPCAFHFVPIQAEVPIHAFWLSVSPLCGLVRPGEKVSVSVEVNIDNWVACRLNAESTGRLEDTLILHTSLGKDHFISITGQYARTCFATNLERLVRMSGPVRNDESLRLREEGRGANAPEELLRLVNWLMTHATDVEDLFLTPGDPELVSSLREALDTGSEFAPSNTERGPHAAAFAVASCLVEFLDSLPEPVIPAVLHADCARASSKEEAYELLANFPTASVNVWISVTAFLHYITQQRSDESRASYAGRSAEIFAPVLLRSNDISPLSLRRFFLYFIS